LFWDRRTGSLEEQAIAVLSNEGEMHSGDEVVLTHLGEIPEDVEAFKALFEVEKPGLAHVADSLAALERSVVSEAVRFDSFVRGRCNAMSGEELLCL
jgi:cytochrome c peroxidase